MITPQHNTIALKLFMVTIVVASGLHMYLKVCGKNEAKTSVVNAVEASLSNPADYLTFNADTCVTLSELWLAGTLLKDAGGDRASIQEDLKTLFCDIGNAGASGDLPTGVCPSIAGNAALVLSLLPSSTNNSNVGPGIYARCIKRIPL